MEVPRLALRKRLRFILVFQDTIVTWLCQTQNMQRICTAGEKKCHHWKTGNSERVKLACLAMSCLSCGQNKHYSPWFLCPVTSTVQPDRPAWLYYLRQNRHAHLIDISSTHNNNPSMFFIQKNREAVRFFWQAVRTPSKNLRHTTGSSHLQDKFTLNLTLCFFQEGRYYTVVC